MKFEIYQPNQKETKPKEWAFKLDNGDRGIILQAVDKETGDKIANLICFYNDHKVAYTQDDARWQLHKHGYGTECFEWDGNGAIKVE